MVSKFLLFVINFHLHYGPVAVQSLKLATSESNTQERLIIVEFDEGIKDIYIPHSGFLQWEEITTISPCLIQCSSDTLSPNI
jgi:hypothetical protein